MITEHLNKSDEIELFNNIVDNYVLSSATDEKGVIQDVSKAFCTLSGYSSEELIGQQHNIVRHPDMSPSAFTHMWDTIKSGNVWRGEIKNRKKDGSFYWVFSTIFPRYEHGEIVGYISLRRDITAEKLLNESERMLQVTSRSAAMGEMIGMIAHQWKQPLNTVAVMLSNLQIKSQLEKLNKTDLEESIKKMHEYMQFLSSTIDDFRGFFKTDKTKEKVSLMHIVSYAARITEPALKESYIELFIRCEDELLSIEESRKCEQFDSYIVSIFKNEMIQVILNLIRNSIDVLLERQVSEPVITIDMYKEGDAYCIDVIDNGGGIDEAFMPKLFLPYETSKGDEGTGLGLYMCKTIIEEHMQGSIHAFNTENGACFRILFKA